MQKFIKKYSLSILVLFGLVTAIGITLLLIEQRQTFQQNAQVATNLNRITFKGRQFYVHGANVPWYNWGCDFGCNANGGVSGNKTVLSAGFQKARNANMNVIRWWVFPGDPWQITRDGTGAPTGINNAVYADFDAALQLAEQYDLYYDFVLFSAATHFPSSWATNTTQRAQLANVLGTLFAKYKNHPRILSWEIYNEPEFQIWNNEIAEQPVVDLATAITSSVHTNSPETLVTVGNAMADGMPMWKNVGLDYYSPHWYDGFSSGGYCMRCNNYDYYKNLYSITIPIVIGENYAGTDVDALQRFEDYRAKGYAGAWPWSLFPERTNDKLAIDYAAATTFGNKYSDIGPRAGTVVTPTNTPTPTTGIASPTPTRTPTPSPTSTPITAQSDLSLSPATQSLTTGTNFQVQVRVNTNGQLVNTVQSNITYPSNLLDIVSVSNSGGAFEIEAEKTLGTGNAKLAYGTTTPKTGNLLVATITFSAKAAGTASVTFDASSVVGSSVSNTNVLRNRTGGTYTITNIVPTATPTAIPGKTGDINKDGFVNLTDLSILLSNWGLSTTTADINKDGTVGLVDLSMLLSNWGL